MSEGEVASPELGGWRYRTHNACEGAGVIIGGAATKKFCVLVVPYPHIFRRVIFGAIDIDESAGAENVTCRRVQNGGTAETVAIGGILAATTAPSLEELVNVDAVADVEVTDPLGAIYYLEALLDSGDDILGPSMTIQVSPQPPGPA